MEDDIDWSRYSPVVPDGQYLAYSTNTPGARRAMLFDSQSHQLQGPPELVERDATDRSERPLIDDVGNSIVAGLVAAGVVGLAAAAPRVRRWWLEAALPGLRDRRRRQAGLLKVVDAAQGAQVTAALAADSLMAPTQLALSIDTVLDDSDVSTISADEAARRLAAISAAAAFIAEQARLLAEAQVRDAVDIAELRRAFEKLTQPHLTASLNSALAANLELLDDRTAQALSAIFGGGQAPNGQNRPLNHDRVAYALRLEQPQAPASPPVAQ